MKNPCNKHYAPSCTRRRYVVVTCAAICLVAFVKEAQIVYPPQTNEGRIIAGVTIAKSPITAERNETSATESTMAGILSTTHPFHDVSDVGTSTSLNTINVVHYESDNIQPRKREHEATEQPSHGKESSSGTAITTSNSLAAGFSTSSPSSSAATIVVQLSGEMANNLHHIAHGIGLQLWARREYGIETNIVLRHDVGPNTRAPKPKWKKAKNAIEKCFPKLSSWDFSEGNTKEFIRMQQLQKDWLGGKSDHLFGLVNSQHPNDIDAGLQLLANEILSQDIQHRPSHSTKTSSSEGPSSSRSPIQLPYLYSQSLDAFPVIDRYYDELRQLFVFNETACCSQIPYHDEYVFHFRNYQSELPGRRAYDMGFAELSPEKTAKELFPHLVRTEHKDTRYGQASEPDGASDTPSSSVTDRKARVAITTRIPNQAARDYIESLSRQGYTARLVTDQTDVEDFCFLARTSRALVGHARSTFVLWAALIGNASTVRLYNVDTYGIRNRHSERFVERFSYNWTNPQLQHRVHFELYKAEEII